MSSPKIPLLISTITLCLSACGPDQAVLDGMQAAAEAMCECAKRASNAPASELWPDEFCEKESKAFDDAHNKLDKEKYGGHEKVEAINEYFHKCWTLQAEARSAAYQKLNPENK